MLKTGLVSITFRKLSPEDIVREVSGAGLHGIEWGGDVHVPHGEGPTAKRVRRLTAEAGLEVACYGSYYRLGVSEAKGLSFEQVLDSAVELGAPSIRVWAGASGSAETDATQRTAVLDDLERVAQLAHAYGITIALEFHANTLTDTPESAVALLRQIKAPNVRSLWQTSNFKPFAYSRNALQMLLPWLDNIHVFNWHPETRERLALADAMPVWTDFLKLATTADEGGGDRFCLLEFVREDSVEQFRDDAHALRELTGL